MRATLDRDNGSGLYEVKFFTSADGVSWSQLGVTKTGSATTSLEQNAAAGQVRVNYADYDGRGLNGGVISAEALDGIDGPTVVDFDASIFTEPYVSATDTLGYSWTLNRTATGLYTTVVDRDMFVFNGSDNEMVIPDDPSLNFDASDDFTLMVVGRTSDGTNSQRTFNKRGLGAANDGYELGWNFSSGDLQMFVGDGTNFTWFPATPIPVPVGQLTTTAVVVNRTTHHVDYFLDGVLSGFDDISTVGDLTNAEPLRFGQWNSAVWFHGSLHDLVMWRRALTPAEIAEADLALTSY